MKKLKALCIGSIVAASSSLAFAGASASIDVANAYIFRGATINDEVNVQPGLEATVDEGALAGLTLGTWANFNTDTEQFDEIDYYVSYGVALTDSLTVDVGYTEYTYPNSGSLAADGVTAEGTDADREVSLGTGGTCPLTGSDISVGAYYGLDGAIEEQLYIELDASNGIDLCEEATLDGGVTAGFIGSAAKDSTADEGVAYVALNASSTILDMVTVGVSYFIETDDAVLAIDEDVLVTVGTGIDF